MISRKLQTEGTSRMLLFAALCSLAIVVALAGCGGSSDSDESGGSENQANTSDTTQKVAVEELKEPSKVEAQKAGMEAAKDPVALPTKKIGILQIARVAESAAMTEDDTIQAAKALGWTTVSCDGEGNPTKIAACADSLINQGVDAIASIGNEAAIIMPQLKRAESAGIPVVDIGGVVAENPLLAAIYAPDTGEEGRVLAEWVADQFDASGETKSIAVADFPAEFAVRRTEAIEKVADERDFDIATTWDVDGANVQTQTQEKVAAATTQYPDLGAVWASYADAISPAGQVINSKFPGKSFPDRPLSVGFGGTSAVLGAIRGGQASAAAEDPGEISGWMAIDQFAQHFGRDAEFDQDPSLSGYGFPLFSYRILTSENIPESGLVPPATDFRAFFESKWGKEFK